MTIGPRVVKTGIAVTLSLYICVWFGLEPAVLAGVAAIFAVQPSIYKTWRHLIDQVISNSIGAIMAIFSLHFLGNEPMIVGINMIAVIMISLKLNMKNTITLTLVTVLAVISTTESEGLLFAVNRFLMILIGIGSAFIVNITIYPPKYKKQFRELSHQSFNDLSLLVRTAISNELTERSFQDGKAKLHSDINTLEELFSIINEERAKMSKINPVDARELVVFKQFLRLLKKGEEILEVVEEHFFQSFTEEISRMEFDEQLEYLMKTNELILLRYEGKVKIDEHNEIYFQRSASFLEKIILTEIESPTDKLRLIVIGSAIFEYAFQLNRLQQILEKFLRINKDS